MTGCLETWIYDTITAHPDEWTSSDLSTRLGIDIYIVFGITADLVERGKIKPGRSGWVLADFKKMEDGYVAVSDDLDHVSWFDSLEEAGEWAKDTAQFCDTKVYIAKVIRTYDPD